MFVLLLSVPREIVFSPEMPISGIWLLLTSVAPPRLQDSVHGKRGRKRENPAGNLGPNPTVPQTSAERPSLTF